MINTPRFDSKQRVAPYFSTFEKTYIANIISKFFKMDEKIVFEIGGSISTNLNQKQRGILIILYFRKFIYQIPIKILQNGEEKSFGGSTSLHLIQKQSKGNLISKFPSKILQNGEEKSFDSSISISFKNKGMPLIFLSIRKLV